MEQELISRRKDTVVLELEWVLRAFYRFETAKVIQVIKHLLGLPSVNVEEAERIAAALACCAATICPC